jgi:hypothetical protein
MKRAREFPQFCINIPTTTEASYGLPTYRQGTYVTCSEARDGHKPEDSASFITLVWCRDEGNGSKPPDILADGWRYDKTSCQLTGIYLFHDHDHLCVFNPKIHCYVYDNEMVAMILKKQDTDQPEQGFDSLDPEQRQEFWSEVKQSAESLKRSAERKADKRWILVNSHCPEEDDEVDLQLVHWPLAPEFVQDLFGENRNCAYMWPKDECWLNWIQDLRENTSFKPSDECISCFNSGENFNNGVKTLPIATHYLFVRS